MRTAEEYLIKEFESDESSLQTAIILNSDVTKLVSAINEARKETIEECAKKATVFHDKYAMINGKKNVSMCAVNKQSILSLINELK